MALNCRQLLAHLILTALNIDNSSPSLINENPNLRSGAAAHHHNRIDDAIPQSPRFVFITKDTFAENEEALSARLIESFNPPPHLPILVVGVTVLILGTALWVLLKAARRDIKEPLEMSLIRTNQDPEEEVETI